VILGCIIFFIILNSNKKPLETFKHIYEYFKNDDEIIEPKLRFLQTKLKPLFAEDVQYYGILENINKKRILNEISLYKGEKSYTINKEDIFLCLTDENDEYYSDNMLIYVLLHEISHSICNEIGHTQKFYDIFDALIEKAVEMNIYDKNIPVVKNYCAHKKKQ
jgi:hypothetical protein